MPVSNYTTKTTGKVRKLVDFECPNCFDTGEFFENERPVCWTCVADRPDLTVRMRPVFSPKTTPSGQE